MLWNIGGPSFWCVLQHVTRCIKLAGVLLTRTFELRFLPLWQSPANVNNLPSPGSPPHMLYIQQTICTICWSRGVLRWALVACRSEWEEEGQKERTRERGVQERTVPWCDFTVNTHARITIIHTHKHTTQTMNTDMQVAIFLWHTQTHTHTGKLYHSLSCKTKWRREAQHLWHTLSLFTHKSLVRRANRRWTPCLHS